MTASGTSIVFVGAAALDSIALVDQYPEPDERRPAESLAHAGGGPAATAAVAAARLGMAAAFVGVVGADAAGSLILDGLRAEGVDVSAVVTDPEAVSGASVGIVDRGGGTRAICSRPAPPPDLSKANRLLRDAAWVHTDHVGWPVLHEYLAGTPVGARLSVDGGNPIPGFTMAGTELYVPTESTLRHRYGSSGIGELLKCALAEGASTVVATRGAAGAAAAETDCGGVVVPGARADVVSTLGAGDVFHGALLAATVHGLPLQRRLAYANTAAALSCNAVDGRSAIPTDAEVRAFAATELESNTTKECV